MSGAELKVYEDHSQLYCKTEHGKQMFLSENEIRASIIFKVKNLYCVCTALMFRSIFIHYI